MKQSLLLFIFVVFLFSCDKIKDANTIDFDTSVTMEVPISVLEKSTADFTFSETGYASLYDEPDIYDHLDKIKSIDVENLHVVFYGLDAMTEISTITLSVQGVGEVVTLTNVTSTNAVHNPNISSSVLKKIADQLESTYQITATLSGSSTTAPVWFTVNMEYDVHIEAEAI